jgi:osmotically inducible lipoprotein OsmB
MQIKTILLAGVATLSLAACMQDPATRGLGGAVVGALAADALDENLIAGAAIGAAGGVATCYVPGAIGCQQGY